MVIDDVVLDMLSQKIKMNVRTPDGATYLALILGKECIENEYKEKAPSVNTVKRLVGLYQSTSPSPQTMNLIARFLEYEDWQELAEDCHIRLASAFVRRDIFKDMASFSRGTLVEVAWQPDRRLLLEHEGDGQYHVIKSENCKLLPDDILSIYSLSIGYPFMADKVFRDEKPLGAYRAAEGSAIHVLKIINPKDAL